MEKIKIATIVSFIIVLACILVGCAYRPLPINIKKYDAVPNEFGIDIVDNLGLSIDGEQMLNNPDRGFRTETYITLGSGKAYPPSSEDAYYKLNREIDRYLDDDPKIIQVYVYLIEFYNKELPESALKQMTDYFTYLKDKGFRALLRFAYEYDGDMKIGPTTNRIISHTEQLKVWFDKNIDLVNDTIYTVQLGMIGLWGEGHNSRHNLDIQKVITAVCEMVPDNIQVMVRTPSLLSQAKSEYESRIGLHDDFLVGIYHPWGMMDFNDPQYQDLLNRCQYFITDGEMPWGEDKTVPNIDPTLFLKQCVGYGLTSLSITHGYKESDKETFYLEEWKKTYLSKQDFLNSKFPFNPAMLNNGKISVYDYLKYHLGYQLGVSNLYESGEKTSFLLNNFGISAPHEFKIEILEDGIITRTIEGLDLKQFSQLKIEVGAKSKVGIRILHKRSNLTAKLANDLIYENGINYLN